VDLAPLIHLHDQAIWYHRQAIQALQAENYPAATTWNRQALALYSNNADFHALAGQLWALQGEFQRAILAWQKARQINPQHNTAHVYLEALEKAIGG
jgi:tetratricopeptide (TPR) repeat protein